MNRESTTEGLPLFRRASLTVARLAVSRDWCTLSTSRSTGNTKWLQSNGSTLTEIRSSVLQADTRSRRATLGSNLQVEHDMEGKKTSQAQQDVGLAATPRMMLVDFSPLDPLRRPRSRHVCLADSPPACHLPSCLLPPCFCPPDSNHDLRLPQLAS